MVQKALEFFLDAVVLGVGGTAAMDLWALVQKRVFKVQPLDYALLGRWLGHCSRGRFRHASIAFAASIAGERVLGWIAHYAIGIVFAGLLIWFWGEEWVRNPSLGPAVIVGIGSIAAPFFMMQPAFGAGFAGSRTRSPNLARLKTVVAHLSFGVGLYLAARIWASLA